MFGCFVVYVSVYRFTLACYLGLCYYYGLLLLCCCFVCSYNSVAVLFIFVVFWFWFDFSVIVFILSVCLLFG